MTADCPGTALSHFLKFCPTGTEVQKCVGGCVNSGVKCVDVVLMVKCEVTDTACLTTTYKDLL